MTNPIIDFTSGSVDHRRKFGGGRGQGLPKACGFKNGVTPFVVDATAGLGRDGFLLASLGAQVIMIERSEQMFELLSDAMARAGDIEQSSPEVVEIMARMSLLQGDAKDVLPQISRHRAPDVVVVDPMHPPRKTKALVKKEMRLIREIVGPDEDSFELMQVALKCARNRVVLKWPQKADPMANLRLPSHQILGKSTRYDVFMVNLND